jgi:Tfp pilus assembly protein PilN
MNPVNLLPVKHRPRTPTGGKQGSAYVVIGVLGAVLVMVLLYVLTVNDINDRKDQVARAKSETTLATGQAAALSGYGNFSKVKEERVQSIKALAQGRIDWERLTRGLARVLPADVWLLTANASASGPPSATPGASAPSTPAPGQTVTADPEVQLTGCAASQPSVAAVLVRLRELSGAKDVVLNEITAPETGSPSGSTAGSAAGSGGQDCGKLHGQTAYKWDASVTFDQTAAAGSPDAKVPASLGGGS